MKQKIFVKGSKLKTKKAQPGRRSKVERERKKLKGAGASLYLYLRFICKPPAKRRGEGEGKR